ncbi:gamma-parvin [Orycteropus afer afer]|uniref:Gamma-parvin n=1 Tax=Orycteropus afer afer TaxID=1230840 RepID=A0A8B6ZWD5_ORYAF|nr:gamma-parvin [Orycteropus afer afer]
MEPESLYNLLQPSKEELPQGEKRKYLPPTSRKDPKFEELQKVLVEWVNATLLPEHIVVRSLEEDMFDGLILHHLFQKLTSVKLEVEEIALTAASQRRKLAVVLEATNQSLQVEERQAPWSVEAIFSRDLLATLHLLVALVKRFQPSLRLPTNVHVEVITIENAKSGMKSEKLVEQFTGCGSRMWLASGCRLLFADGVILLLLIGQLQGFFLHLKEFYLTPSSPAEMVHNVTLALELLKDEGLLTYPVNPEDIVNKDTKSTLRVLYGLFHRHRLAESADGLPRGAPS